MLLLCSPSSAPSSAPAQVHVLTQLKVLSLTQVVGDLIHVLKGFHPQTDDVHKVLHQPEELPDVWPQLRDRRARRKRRVREELLISSERGEKVQGSSSGLRFRFRFRLKVQGSGFRFRFRLKAQGFS